MPRIVHQAVLPSQGVLVGSGPIANLDNGGVGFDSPYQKWTVSADMTYYRTGWQGSHELQFGFYGQPLIRVKSNQVLPADGFVAQEEVLRNPANPAAGTIPFHKQIYSLTSYTDTFLDSSDYAVYVQDSWRPASRVTITAGLRADFISRTDKLFDVKVQDTTAVGPRVGVNYILTADARNALRASWGRVHETLAQNIETAGTNIAGVRDEFDTDLNGTFETVLSTPSRTAVASNRQLDVGRNQPRVDEWTVGYRRQLPWQMVFDASFLRREYRDRTGYIEVNGIYTGQRLQGLPGSRPRTRSTA